MFECIVIGGGHAGVEAALAIARKNHKTILITTDIKNIATMPCNPSIGGPAKGTVVREIDALGGEMARCADKTQIQIKMLNKSKGPAVRALRMQSDKIDYPNEMLITLKKEKNLTIKQAIVKEILIDNNKVTGVMTEEGFIAKGKAVIITTGTYMRSKILRGDVITKNGPDNQMTSEFLSNQLKSLGFDIIRLKTGTPSRIITSTIDFSKHNLEPGDKEKRTFSFDNIVYDRKDVPCYLTYTTKETQRIIEENLTKSAMYSGVVEGVGPRYCPSIEDKMVRFSTKERHQLFLEPESTHLDETYLQGLSTSMPVDIQDLMIRSIKGLENCKVKRYAYAIEYDAINPQSLWPTLESKIIENLYFAGQINGTSGYEEAACQGLMAGINACLKLENKEPFILKRNEAYIGVLIDDLITKGIKDPYRLLTSRAEYRLLLRHDNADIRLMEYGYKYGLISDSKYNCFLNKKAKIKELEEYVKKTKVATKDANKYLQKINSAIIREGTPLINLLKRPEFGYKNLLELAKIDYDYEVAEQVEIKIKYEGYIKKTNEQVEKMLKSEEYKIPFDFDYNIVKNLASEAKEKLKKIKPLTLGQAMRISGVNPSDISQIIIYLKRS